jgi:putative aminopeptidase FrvX
VYTGTIISTSPATHVYPDANSKSRSVENLEVRLDEVVKNAQDVKKLGINNGDIVCYDVKFTLTESGFLKTRFIDDKASVVILLMLLKYIKENNVKLKYDTKMYFVVYEEVGHGAASVDKNIDEFVTLDMGCVGLDLAGNEFAVSICAKDSGGPYDYELTTRLINMAKDNNLNYTVDIFPFYGSDVGAARRAGVDIKGALIGTGVAASHGMERTHIDGIINTLKLIYIYLAK